MFKLQKLKLKENRKKKFKNKRPNVKKKDESKRAD